MMFRFLLQIIPFSPVHCSTWLAHLAYVSHQLPEREGRCPFPTSSYANGASEFLDPENMGIAAIVIIITLLFCLEDKIQVPKTLLLAPFAQTWT